MNRNDWARWILLSLGGLFAFGVFAVTGPEVARGAERIVLGEEFTATW